MWIHRFNLTCKRSWTADLTMLTLAYAFSSARFTAWTAEPAQREQRYRFAWLRVANPGGEWEILKSNAKCSQWGFLMLSPFFSCLFSWSVGMRKDFYETRRVDGVNEGDKHLGWCLVLKAGLPMPQAGCLFVAVDAVWSTDRFEHVKLVFQTMQGFKATGRTKLQFEQNHMRMRRLMQFAQHHALYCNIMENLC